MLKMIASRLTRLVLTVLVVTFVTFFLTNVLPGDAVNALIPIDAQQDREFVEQVREEWGLNDPLIVRYGRWLGDAVQGDLGRSLVTGQPVTDEITHRLPITLEIMVVAVGFSLLVAVPLGAFRLSGGAKIRSRVQRGCPGRPQSAFVRHRADPHLRVCPKAPMVPRRRMEQAQ